MQSGTSMIGRSLFAGLMLTLASAHGATCSVTSLPGLNFGSYDPFSAIDLDIATAATVTCTSTVPAPGEWVLIFTSISRGGAPSFSPRQMRNAAGNTLNYNLYTDTLRTTIYGDGSSGTSRRVLLTRPSASAPFILTDDIFGRIVAGQDASVGSYSDTLIYTVNF
jgi:spore coat protein U-like protein